MATPNPLMINKVLLYWLTSSLVPWGPVNKVKKDNEFSAATEAWWRRSADKPQCGCTRSSMVSCLPWDHDVTVNGCVCVHNHKLADGIQRLMYCPASTCTGRGRRIQSHVAVTVTLFSFNFLRVKDTMALGAPQPANSLFWYSRVTSCKHEVSPKRPNAIQR